MEPRCGAECTQRAEASAGGTDKPLGVSHGGGQPFARGCRTGEPGVWQVGRPDRSNGVKGDGARSHGGTNREPRQGDQRGDTDEAHHERDRQQEVPGTRKRHGEAGHDGPARKTSEMGIWIGGLGHWGGLQ